MIAPTQDCVLGRGASVNVHDTRERGAAAGKAGAANWARARTVATNGRNKASLMPTS